MKILLIIIVIIAIAILMLQIYLAAKYPQVERDLRFIGWVVSKICTYNTSEELRTFAKKIDNPDKKLPYHKEIEVSEHVIKNRDGGDLPVIIYRPKNVRPKAAGLFWIHGGGYAMNSAKDELGAIKEMLLETNSIAVSPEYRKSIEVPYPAALNDCYDALLWMQEHAEELGINKHQIIVAGASAGGGLAAAVTLYARDDRRVQVAFHLPVYPMIDDRMETKSMIGNREFVWDEIKNRAGWQLYLGELYKTDDVPAYAAAARETDLSGMPPAYTIVGNLDPFLDETLQYIARLKAAGVEARCDVFDGAYHGFDMIPSKVGRRAKRARIDAYKYAVEHYFT